MATMLLNSGWYCFLSLNFCVNSKLDVITIYCHSFPGLILKLL